MPSREDWKLPSNPQLLRFLLLVASGWAAMQLLATFQVVLLLFSAAAVLAVLLNVPVRWLGRLLPRPLAIAVSVTAALTAGLGLAWVLGLQLVSQGSQLLAQLEAVMADPGLPFRARLSTYLDQLDLERIIELVRSNFDTGIGVLGGAVGNLLGLVFLVVLTVYMLVDDGRLWRSLLQLLPPERRAQVHRSVRRNVLGFLRGQITLVIFLTSTSLLAFGLLGVRFPLILAIVVGVLDAIPGIGATLGVIIISAVVLATQGFGMAVGVLLASVLLQQVQDNVLQPRVMGRVLSIPPLVVFLALFLGERIAGLLGIFLAIPVAGMVVNWHRDRDGQDPARPGGAEGSADG
ncbi:AI-2E family transporter [Cyanobium sp. CH-040]|uniref:AI-2E family transporter n=1 Tax=Cyanobium sp. CH-040 TaxID=2823708 RepID=UPI0020CC8C21|nr:AI-2E family transporter [Cyanobium sp. CH-040]MCP9928688.1 AI-2E family transporter [Cyanobium sp. CH-040]